MYAQKSDCSPSSVLADLEAHGIHLNRLALSPSSPSFLVGKRGNAHSDYDSGYESDDPMIMDDSSDDADTLSEPSLSQGSAPSSTWNSRNLIPNPKFDLREAYLASIKGVTFEHIEEDIIHIHDEVHSGCQPAHLDALNDSFSRPSMEAAMDHFYGYEPEAVETSLSGDEGSDSDLETEMISEPPQKRCRGLLPPAEGPSWKEVDFQYVFVNGDGPEYELSDEDDDRDTSVQPWSRASGSSRRRRRGRSRRGRSAAASAKRELLSHVRPITRRRFQSVD